MPSNHYQFDGDNGFIIHDYNRQAPFSSFLPGIAGEQGRPAWAFYVNRGQGLASFGVRNKDGAMLEFYPADKAYQLTASRGFRTFLKIGEAGKTTTYEPFQRTADPAVQQRLIVQPHEFSVEETHADLGLRIRVDYFTLPQAAVPALVRRVTITNTSPTPQHIDIVDGLPQVLPYGMDQWCTKNMSRTAEAMMAVDGVADNTPFYRLKAFPGDSPVVLPVVGGNFFAGYMGTERTRTCVDWQRIFGGAADFSVPERFYADAALDLEGQVGGNRTPSAFQILAMELGAGAARQFYGIYGNAPSWNALQAFLATLTGEAYFEVKRAENRQLIQRLTQSAFTATAHPVLDAYTRQSYLDNGLRGGFSVPVPGGIRLHLFGRKHGDLERDYNNFLVPDTPYSEGDGNWRDMLQNRRTDLFFDPSLGSRNIRYFFNLIQPDGYNPLVLRNSRYVVTDASQLAADCAAVPGLQQLVSRPFKYGQLWELLKLQQPDADLEPVLRRILGAAVQEEDAELETGYWSDHWTYLVDLLEAFAAIYPERMGDLLGEGGYSFFDPTHCVQPRSAKYRMTERGVRQDGAVQARKDKIALIHSRPQFAHRSRAQQGVGEVVTTTLLGKVLTLVANKLAALDPLGIGIEMEADRPGWCDALNGLPGLFGSSVNETIELKRLVDFTHTALAGSSASCVLPSELFELLNALHALHSLVPAVNGQAHCHALWDARHNLLEGYRAQVFMGFGGAQKALSHGTARSMLGDISAFLTTAIAKASNTDGSITTYCAFEADTFTERADGTVHITAFAPRPLPLFLEGFVHAMRIATPAQARDLYLAVQKSDLYDRKLGMYRLNVPLTAQNFGNVLDLGRQGIFNYGWLENGSIFLHMHTKFVLEMLRGGLVQEFYANIDKLLIPLRDPAEYRRSTTENVSFIVSSGFDIDPREHGAGYVARLSGSTVEYLHIWTHLFLGARPFVFEDGELIFRPQPSLSHTLFTQQERLAQPFGADEWLPAHSASCAFLGDTLLVYTNPQRRDTFGTHATAIQTIALYGRDGSVQTVRAAELRGAAALALREGRVRRIELALA